MKDIQQLIKGATEPLLLYLINEIPMYGYQIIGELEKRTTGYFKLRGGTIYPMLRRLEDKGLVKSSWRQITERQRRRYYAITDKGRQLLADRLVEWQDFSTAVSMLMGTNLNR
jgi:PadR family transcriptional regulator PadR|tara:strand:+ start:1229 stop:1567 length:339 start_codon:yes stop_codon:yes gene_type:complete